MRVATLISKRSGPRARVARGSRSSARESTPERRGVDAMLERLPPIDEEDGHVEPVGGDERGIAVDVDHLERRGHRAAHLVDDRLHLVAEVTILPAVEHQMPHDEPS